MILTLISPYYEYGQNTITSWNALHFRADVLYQITKKVKIITQFVPSAI